MLKKYMNDLGYTEEEIRAILNTYPLCSCREETLYRYVSEKYQFFVELGFNSEEIKKITNVHPGFFLMG